MTVCSSGHPLTNNQQTSRNSGSFIPKMNNIYPGNVSGFSELTNSYKGKESKNLSFKSYMPLCYFGVQEKCISSPLKCSHSRGGILKYLLLFLLSSTPSAPNHLSKAHL